MKKQTFKKPQFPSIYRIITENKTFQKLAKIDFKLLTVFLIVIFLLIGISVLGIKLYQDMSIYAKTISQRQNLQEKINFWQSFTQKYEGYKDAYFQIALLQYRLGNFENARLYNKKALLLDPGFEGAKNLEVLLENK